jgi:hypothetical protein
MIYPPYGGVKAILKNACGLEAKKSEQEFSGSIFTKMP